MEPQQPPQDQPHDPLTASPDAEALMQIESIESEGTTTPAPAPVAPVAPMTPVAPATNPMQPMGDQSTPVGQPATQPVATAQPVEPALVAEAPQFAPIEPAPYQAPADTPAQPIAPEAPAFQPSGADQPAATNASPAAEATPPTSSPVEPAVLGADSSAAPTMPFPAAPTETAKKLFNVPVTKRTLVMVAALVVVAGVAVGVIIWSTL